MRLYPHPSERIALGEVGTTGNGPLAIVSYGNGHYLSMQAAALLAADGIAARIIDIRWIAPLPTEQIVAALKGAKKVLIVDECRVSGNVSEALMAVLNEKTNLPVVRIAADDSFIATGPAYAVTMPSRESIVTAAKGLWSAK